MKFFRRQPRDAPGGDRADERGEPGRAGSRGLFAEGSGPSPDVAVAEARAALKRIVDEALLLQDLAEDMLEGVRMQRPLDELAGPGGVLVSRFGTLRASLPRSADPVLRRHRDVVARVLDHHATLLASALDLRTVDRRSERMAEQLQRLDGFGAPAQWLRAVHAELADGQEPSPVGPGEARG
jgi:hypothetical protein